MNAHAHRTGVDVVADLVGKLAVAVAMLGKCANDCARCGGLGELRETIPAYVMTDAGTLRSRGYALNAIRAQVERYGPRVMKRPAGAGMLRTPCPGCLKIRQVVEICKGNQ